MDSDPSTILFSRMQRKFNKACADYGLIENGDHILIGLSGGKDSLALVELLAARRKIFVPRFKVSAVHVSMTNIGYRSDLDYLRNFCESRGVPFLHVTTSFDPRPEFRSSKTPCFLCSWYRRKALFKTAQESGCNKIALGHHQDDVLETFLLNLIYQGSVSTIPPRLKMDKFPMVMIRPLYLIRESELAEYAQCAQYRKVEKLCPYEHESSRSQAKALLADLERLNPDTRNSLWNAIHNIKLGYLPEKIEN